jgi:MFS family permease
MSLRRISRTALRRISLTGPSWIRGSAESLRSVLALPGARLLAATSLVARLPKGMVPLAIVLLLRQATGSYAIAGITAACTAIGDAASTPVQGRLVDRFGRGWVLIPTAAVHAAAVAAVLILTRGHAPAPAVAGCACAAGIGMPPVSGSIKAVWPQIAGQDLLPAAYVVESLLQQVIFLAGPLLVAVLTVIDGPATALACAAVLVAGGTAGFVVASRSAPGVRRDRRGHGAWRVRAVRILVCCTVLQSLTFGVLPVGLAAVAADAGLPDLAGVLLATLTLGGILGTFWPVAAASAGRYARLGGGFAAALVPVAVLAAWPYAGDLVAIGGILALAGLFLTPMAATSYVLIERATAAAHRTEAFAWLSTGQATGNAAGAALAGILTSSLGAPAALGIVPVAVGLGAVIARYLRLGGRGENPGLIGEICLIREIKSRHAAGVKARLWPSGSGERRTNIVSLRTAASTQVPPLHQVLRRHSEPLPGPDAKMPSHRATDDFPFGRYYSW